MSLRSQTWNLGQTPLVTEGLAHAGKRCWVVGWSMFQRPHFTDQYLYRWLGCCGSSSGRPGKQCCECEEVKKLLGFVADVTVLR
jgi:hypothetical protein